MFVGTVLMTTIAVFATTPRYTAETKLLIERSTPQVLDIRQVFADGLTSDVEDEYYKTQFDLLKSETIAAQVIRDLDFGKQPRILVAARKDC